MKGSSRAKPFWRELRASRGGSNTETMVVAGFLTTCCCLIIHVICRGGVVTLAAFSSSKNSRRSRSHARLRRKANANADHAVLFKKGQRLRHHHSRPFYAAERVMTDDDNVKTTATTPSSTAAADRAFRSGISLEKAGRARSASAAFHEAAALYRRYLDGGGDDDTTTFDNHDITSSPSSSSSNNNNDGAANNNNDDDDDNAYDDSNNNADDNELVVSLLAYCYIRIGHLTNDAFGNAIDATKFYRLATTVDATYPSAVSYHGIGTCIEASLDGTATATATSGANDDDDNDDDDDGKRKVEVVQQQQQQQQQQQNNAEINNNNWKKQMIHAIESYRKANEILMSNSNNNDDEVVRFHLAVALERIGEVEESTQIMDYLRCDDRVDDDDDDNNDSNEENNNLVSYSYLVNSWGYVRWHTRRIPTHLLNLHRGTRAMLQIALHAALPLLLPLKDNNNNNNGGGGLVCEFGVASGRSIRMIKELLLMEEEDIQIHGFDTFTGLPSAWGDEPAGSYSTGGAIPNMMEETTTTTEGSSGGGGGGSDERTSEGSSSSNVIFHQGLFRDTIPSFLSTIDKGRPLAYANIDCDLYSSTRDVLEAFHGRIVPGTVLVFDEYLCHPSWRQDEFRAWRECCKRFGWQYEYLAFSLSTKQVVVRVTS